MNQATPFASLTPAMIRRARLAPAQEALPPESRSGLRDDLKLFAVAWLAGFVFFFVFLG
jgi:hypothetical protein